jgi:hypothetical protein
LLNWVTLTLGTISRMTRLQRVILIGSIILPAGSLILIFSQLGRRIIAKLTKEKTLKTFGNGFDVILTNKEIKKDLYERK